jgi:hypothetical protein
LNFDIILNKVGINYIKRGVRYYIIIILNIIKIKLDVDTADYQGCSSLGNMGGWGGYSTKIVRHKFSNRELYSDSDKGLNCDQ